MNEFKRSIDLFLLNLFKKQQQKRRYNMEYQSSRSTTSTRLRNSLLDGPRDLAQGRVMILCTYVSRGSRYFQTLNILGNDKEHIDLKTLTRFSYIHIF